MLDQVEPRLRKALPAGHIAFAAIPRGYANAALARGDLEAALDLTNRSIGLYEVSIKAGGPGVDNMPGMLGRRSNIERRLGHYDAAVSDAERALTLARRRATPGAFSTLIGRIQLALGRALASQGKGEEARAAFAGAAQHLEGTVGPDHPDTKAARQLAADPR